MPDVGESLLALARNAINVRLGQPMTAVADHPALHENGATFVTLTQHGNLRGCIGSLEAWRPLSKDVQENALAAAFRDPRFRPLSADELPGTRVEVSLLTPAEPMSFSAKPTLSPSSGQKSTASFSPREITAQPFCRRSGNNCPIPSVSWPT
jgi:AmmeMemoRadiSam system protein A